jgi:Uma2 family endonuclease
MADKRADYFAAGTEVVWDVDPRAEVVHVYRRSAPDQPMTYRRGEVAEAEPAVPGWRMAVDEIFWLAN